MPSAKCWKCQFLAKAGRTLDDFCLFKANFNLNFEACRKRFFCPKNPLLCGVITIINCSQSRRPWTLIINIMFDDSWSGCLWRDTRDSQWERASVTYRMLRASTAEAWQPQTCHESREHHPYSFLYFVFHCETERVPGEQLTTLIVLYLFFFSSHVWSRECPWDHVSLWNRSYSLQVCGLTVCSNHLVCTFRGL